MKSDMEDPQDDAETLCDMVNLLNLSPELTAELQDRIRNPGKKDDFSKAGLPGLRAAVKLLRDEVVKLRVRVETLERTRPSGEGGIAGVGGLG